jgi:cytoskeletal protein RodZ
MRILTLTVILGLPLLALGQQTEPQQTQEQTKETQATAPVKGKKKYQQEPSNPQAKPETGANVQEQTTVKGHAPDVNRHETGVNRNETGTRSSMHETNMTGTNQTTTVNKQEFMSRHSEVFHLGRHPKEFFIQRYGASHVRLIGNEYFAFVDGCWVAVDVDGFVYSQRVICAGDPEFIEVE